MFSPELHLRRILLRLGLWLVLLFSVGESMAFADAFSNQVTSAQQEAVRKYPDLGKAGTPLNTAFVAEVRRLRTENPAFFSQPRWPVMLADRIALQSISVDQLTTALWRLCLIPVISAVALALSAVAFARETASFGKAALLVLASISIDIGYVVVLCLLFFSVFGGEKSSSMVVCSIALFILVRIVWIMMVSRTFQVSVGRALGINIVANVICYPVFALCGFDPHWNPITQIDKALTLWSGYGAHAGFHLGGGGKLDPSSGFHGHIGGGRE